MTIISLKRISPMKSCPMSMQAFTLSTLTWISEIFYRVSSGILYLLLECESFASGTLHVCFLTWTTAVKVIPSICFGLSRVKFKVMCLFFVHISSNPRSLEWVSLHPRTLAKIDEEKVIHGDVLTG